MFLPGLVLLPLASASVLLRGGTFITYSVENSDLEIVDDGAMLFNDMILQISKTIDGLDHLQDGVTVVNTTGKIISPGFVDTHRHTWQAALRTLAADTQLVNLFPRFGAPGLPATVFSPSDVYIGTLMGMLEGLNAGITTTVDFAHMTWTRQHAESALQGVLDSGTRAWWCYTIQPVTTSGDPFTVDFNAPADQLAHVAQLAQNNPYNDGLVTLGIAYDGYTPNDPTSKAVIETARNHSLSLMTSHSVGSAYGILDHMISVVNDIPVTPSALNSSLAFIFAHCDNIDASEMNLLREFDQYISITPESEMHYGLGHPYSYLIQDQASLGVDTYFTYSIDLLHQMRIWLQSTRLQLYQQELDQAKIPSDTPMTVKQAFLLGTRNGGQAVKRPDIGVLREGAKADVLIFSTDSIGFVGWTDPVAAVVLHANVGDIEEVYVDGKLVKTGGRLVVDWQGKGYADMLRESGAKFRDAYAKANISAFEEGTNALYGLSESAFAAPFRVTVTRG